MKPNMTNALILDSKKRALLIHNCKNGSDRWEFPGGKVEEGDLSLEDRTIDELNQELGIKIMIKSAFGDYKTKSPEGEFLCRTFVAEIVEGNPKIIERHKHDFWGYFSYSELVRLKNEGSLVPNLVSMLPKLEKYLREL